MKIARRLAITCIVIALLIFMLLSACVTPTPSSAPRSDTTTKPGATQVPASTSTLVPTSKPASSPAAATAPKKAVVLKAVSHTVVTQRGATTDAGFMDFMQKINERSNGELKITYLGSAEALPTGQQFEAMSKGVVEMVHQAGAYHEDIVAAGAALGATEITPWEEREVGFWDLYTKLLKPLNVIPLGRSGFDYRFYIYSNVKIQKLDDFKGLKCRSNSAYDPIVKPLGMVAVEMPSAEMYTAMERGMIKAFLNPIYISDRWQLQEVTKFRIDHGFWNAPAAVFMNLKVFEGLPAHLQKLLLDTMIEIEKVDSVRLNEEFIGKENKTQLAAGIQFLKLSPEEADKLLEICKDAKWKPLIQKDKVNGPIMFDMLTLKGKLYQQMLAKKK